MSVMTGNDAAASAIQASQETHGFSLYRLLPLLVFVLSLLVTLYLWRIAKAETEHVLQHEFLYETQEIQSKIVHQMAMYESMLHGAKGLFAATRSVDRNQFREYVSALRLEKNFPGVQGLGYAHLLRREQIPGFVREMHRKGLGDYRIFPAGEREQYAPVVYLEPADGINLQVPGFDALSETGRKLSMEKARDSGQCVISPLLHLLNDRALGQQIGFIMWLPVYRNGQFHNTRNQRRLNLLGWVYSPFSMQDLMQSMFASELPRVIFEIYDGSQVDEQMLMYRHGKVLQGVNGHGPYFSAISHVEISGRDWTLQYFSVPEFDQRLLNQRPRSIALAGILISILLTLLTWSLVDGRSRAISVTRRLARELQERRRAEADMRLAKKVIENVDTAVLVTDPQSIILQVNPAFTAITGYTAAEAVGKKSKLLASGAHTPEFFSEMWQVLNNTGSWQGEIFNRRKNGEFYTEWLSINAVRDETGQLTNYVALFSDISERKAAEAHMVNLAHYDPLTGLPNRTLLTDRLQQAISTAKREQHFMVVMFIDLDKFKPINDTLGHHVGDILLKEVAIRIQDCLRESDTAARIGGDEFVVLLPMVDKEGDAYAVAEKIRKALDESFMIMGHQLNISSSIGIAVFPEHGRDEKSLLMNADSAMYHAKETGRNRVVRYDPSMKLQ